MRLFFLLLVLFSLGGCLNPWKLPPISTAKDEHTGDSNGTQHSTQQQDSPSLRPVSGKITRTFSDGSHYEGEAQNSEPHGEGSLVWPDGARYTGMFRQGQRTGYGVFSWPSGNRFEGEFKNGKRHGRGKFIWSNGARYSGTYQMGKKHGAGVFQHTNKTVEVCYKIPKRQTQYWDNGKLTIENGPLQDEPLPDLDREARLHPVKTTFHPRMSWYLSKITQPPIDAKPVRQVAALPQSRRWHHTQTGMTFASVPSGCFQMGSNNHAANEKPPHEVCLDAFWIGVHEVTQGVWQQRMGTLPEQSQTGENLPVENVSWNDVQNFIKTLNRSGPTQFRLPNEAEWEFACRSAGRQEPFCGGNAVNDLAWHKENSGNHAHPIGERQANDLGLYDMSGNVWEWVTDWYDANYYQRSPKNNPKGPATGRSKVFRGGSWLSAPRFLRSSLRYDLAPDRGYNLLGMRLVAIPPSAVNTIGVTYE